MYTPEPAFAQVERLVRKFKALSSAQRKSMNEDATRQSFIMPLFKALGWNTADFNEVSPEEKVSRGYVDFSFRLGGIPRFFLETKRASENLNDPRWITQAIDCAWTKNVTWALLSDFEGLRVFNAEWKEANPFSMQFIQFDLDSYLSDFDSLLWLSREQTAVGRLDREAEKVGKKVRRLPVGQHLIDDLKTWRAGLYKEMRGFNPMWSPAQVDEAVLRILNRLIFIRTAEDRGVEENRLLSLVRELQGKRQRANLWAELVKLFREMDSVYNSELFAPHLSETLQATPLVLEGIIDELYEKNYVRYNFNAIDSDVLGTVYEQYLGSIVTESKEETQLSMLPQAAPTVEERRQKRKSQGIYYTPAFVTKYIVQQTLGKYLEENGYNPSHPPRVLDMACGSGSFLIEAFDVLDAFVARQRGHIHGEKEELHDYARRLELLHNCIYGVDKDKQAVDVARLNLLLRALHWRDKLPMLGNLHHADSLRPETWEDFKEVMGAGGFDIIIGNPPYVRQETLGEQFKSFAKEHFETYAGTADLYIYFIEQAHRLLKPGGWFGMIVSNKWVRSNYGRALRQFLENNTTILEIIDFGELPVFGEVIAYPMILVFRKQATQKQNFIFAPIKRLDFSTLLDEVKSIGSTLNEASFSAGTWTVNVEQEHAILEKIRHMGVPLGEYLHGKIFFGIKTGYNKAFVIDGITRDHLVSKDIKTKDLIKPFLLGRNIQRYHIEFANKYLILLPRGWTNQQYNYGVDNWEWFEKDYPFLTNHLSSLSLNWL